MSRKKWTIAHIDKDTAAQVAENHSLDPFTALILVSRGITDYEDVEEFFDNDFSFCDPFLIADMDKAVERIKKAVENFEKICVWGDYDAGRRDIYGFNVFIFVRARRGCYVLYSRQNNRGLRNVLQRG